VEIIDVTFKIILILLKMQVNFIRLNNYFLFAIKKDFIQNLILYFKLNLFLFFMHKILIYQCLIRFLD